MKLHEPKPNSIVFYNTLNDLQMEVLRISHDGVIANPEIPTDEAADAVIRALDGHIKTLMRREYDRGFEDGKTRP